MSLAAAMTVAVLNIHHKGGQGHRVPILVRKVLLQWLGKILRVEYKRKDTVQQEMNADRATDESQHDNNNERSRDFGQTIHTPRSETRRKRRATDTTHNIGHLAMIHANNSSTVDTDKITEIRKEWELLAFVLDRICLIIFSILIVVVAWVMLTDHPNTKF